MSFRVIRSPRATADILNIVAYLAEHSDSAAVRFLESLAKAQEQLAVFPNSAATGLLTESRRFVLGDYYIVSYRVRREIVQIFAVRHAKRRDTQP